MLIKLVLICVCIIITYPNQAYSSCSGSGLAYTCTSGSSAAQINAAIAAASDEAVITFSNGNYSDTGISLNGRNGISLVCESVGGCTFTSSGDIIGIDYIPLARTNLIRVSGFNFTANSNTAKIWFYGDENLEKIRIDNCSFSGLSTGYIAILLGSTGTTGRAYGVIDNNSFTGTTNHMALKALSGGETWVNGLQGSANNIFFEDNTISFSGNDDLGSGAIDAWMATAIVVRNNSISGSRVVNHSLCHSGPINSEIYNNTIANNVSDPANYRNIHWQGSGEIIAFGNTITGGHMALQHYRSDASQMPQGDCTAETICDGSEAIDGNRDGQFGYPCWHQPGRNEAGTLRPIYLWNNKQPDGQRVDLSLESGGYMESYHVKADRDYFEAVSADPQTSSTYPFDGSTGMGFGTLANRPATCSVGFTDSADAGFGGVGYFAYDTNTLYRCSASNEWTVHYSPYTYPHPLRGETPASGSTTIGSGTGSTTIGSGTGSVTWQ